MSNKFYDIEPAADGSHYLCCNGRAIARYSDLAAAESAREEFTLEIEDRRTERLAAQVILEGAGNAFAQ